MKIALLGDLHGNWPAVEAVDRHIKAQGVDKVYCLGDLVGKGPRSPETMDWALARCQVVLRGNWDEGVALAPPDSAGGQWYKKQLGEARCEALRTLPWEHRFAFAGRRVRLLHGRPLVPEVVYSDAPEAARRKLFEGPDGYAPDLVIFADIHRPFYQQIPPLGVLMNTGSVGNPLAGQPFPSYLVLEGEPGEAPGPLSYTFFQLEYDREEAVRQAEETPDLPLREAFIREVRTGYYSR